MIFYSYIIPRYLYMEEIRKLFYGPKHGLQNINNAFYIASLYPKRFNYDGYLMELLTIVKNQERL